MACDISYGRIEACKSNVGGLRNMFIANYQADFIENATFSVNEEITALAAPIDVFKFELRGDNNTFEEANENSRDNGTSFWTQTANIAIKKQDKYSQAQLKLLSYGRPHVIFEDYNGNFRVIGAQNGCEISVSSATGGAMGDMNGYNLTIEGKELSMGYFIDSTIMDNAAGFAVSALVIEDGVPSA